ncbi:protein spartin [Penaeus vannamei]|uniref:protein spartin n=1 Tax=Penaeus vannamei TaxID=6689 RepID=UPI00387F3F36
MLALCMYRQVEGVLEVAAGAVKGASTVYMSLESAAATLATSITQNTVKVVTHKYGEEAGSLTDNTLYAVGQTALVGHNIASLGVKGIAKRTAKDTGKALVHQHEERKQSKVGGGVEEAEEAMEVTEEDGNNPPTKPIREKKKKPL